ncbi:hypothetical protein HDU93_008400 [Gonapodya sp. JEL0774]|nr:hypothetical protein HDU93_008400 [Gonapodya sp. JEL0774]
MFGKIFGAAETLKFPDRKRRVVIVGGGYAGVELAQTLEKSVTEDAVEILLLEKKDAYFHSIGSLRAVVESESIDKVWIPYDKAFKTKAVTVRTGVEVINVSPNFVATSAGETILYDFLILTTGSWGPQPGKFNVNTAEEGKRILRSMHAALKSDSTKSVLIVGAGAVGVELSGEIATDFPSKKVYLLESGPTILPFPQVAPKLRESAASELKKLGVEIITGEKANLTKEDFDGVWKGAGTRTIKTDKGREITTDLQIISIGNSAFNSYPLAQHLSHLIDEKTKEVIVKRTLQVGDDRLPWIFALGDVAKTGAGKNYSAAIAHIPIVANNIVSLLQAEAAAGVAGDNQSARLKALKDVKLKEIVDAPFMMLVTVGRRSGAMQAPMNMFGKPLVMGPWISAKIKSETVFIPKTRAGMGY